MASLFETVAGISSDTFTIEGVRFMAAPFTISEQAAYFALPTETDTDASGRAFQYVPHDVRFEYLAERLRRRVKDAKADPKDITAEWLMDHLPVPMLDPLLHLLMHGKMPDGAGGNTKA